MRLSNYQIEIIKKYTLEIFNTQKVYLFGSRVNDNKRGGDIDLYIELEDKIFSKTKKIFRRAKN